MGRAKLNMELISNEKSRNTTLKKRKEGLIRKMHEFTTLCDVKACMIIYTPNHPAAEVWPPNADDQVGRIIDVYKSKTKDSANKTFGVPDFFHDRRRKIEDELAKLRRKNLEAKYPIAPPLLNFATESQLRDFSMLLSNKAKYVKSRLEMLSANKQVSFYYPPPPVASATAAVVQQSAVSGFNHHRVQEVNHHNSAMMLLMNESNHHFESIQFKRQLYFETAGGFWAPPPLPSPHPPPQPYVHFSNREDFL